MCNTKWYKRTCKLGSCETEMKYIINKEPSLKRGIWPVTSLIML